MKIGLIYRLLFATGVCSALFVLAYARPLEPKPKHTAIIGFYNVENLFDTIDDPEKQDEEFTPDSEKNWNQERYLAKLNRISEVISALGGDEFPAIMGLSEVENLSVLQDLCELESLKKAKYEPILIEGPDQRGIDVAMIYSKAKFKPVEVGRRTIDMGADERPTRDILYVKGKLKKGPTVHILVNHWPSRYGGAEKSEPKRIAAAKVLAAIVDSIGNAAPSEGIICMGDFNDYPNNRSLSEILPTGEGEILVNLMSGLDEAKRGSYNYRGEWGFLDQIIVSKNLSDGSIPDVLPGKTAPFFTDSMVFVHPEYGDIKPSRTYGGPNYYGGYSDHLPVYTILGY